MITQIDEPIKVGVVFEESGTIIPKWFIWNGQKRNIEKVTFAWKVQEGSALLHHFAVAEGINLYELCFDTSRQAWRLMAISNV